MQSNKTTKNYLLFLDQMCETVKIQMRKMLRTFFPFFKSLNLHVEAKHFNFTGLDPFVVSVPQLFVYFM